MMNYAMSRKQPINDGDTGDISGLLRVRGVTLKKTTWVAEIFSSGMYSADEVSLGLSPDARNISGTQLGERP